VREQENPFGPGPPESADNSLASAWWRVLEADHVGRRVHELDLAAKRSQAPGDEIGDPIQPFDIRAAGLDGDQLT
jgi:hypothetical protein